MNPNLLLTIILGLFSCGQALPRRAALQQEQEKDLSVHPYVKVRAIPLPPGYWRVAIDSSSFGAWLRDCPLKKDPTVYLYNGQPKRNQKAQFAVLDISVGTKDLQQCADAVMRLRAEYLYSRRDFGAIDFYTGQGTELNFLEWAKGKRYKQTGGRLVAYMGQGAGGTCKERSCFDDYLETVFSYCGTLSLERQLAPEDMRDMQIGDVLIRGGSPGHAMIVMDMARNAAGHIIYLLAQSYMPAQDIHIVLNPDKGDQDPWYTVQEGPVTTPEWVFRSGQLRTWPIKGR